MTPWKTKSSKNFLLVIEKDIILWTVFWVTNRFQKCLQLTMHLSNLEYLRVRYGTNDKRTPSNLETNSLFSKRYITSNIIVMENYKRCFKKQFFSLVKHKFRLHFWQNTKVLWSVIFILAIMASYLKWHVCWDFSGNGWFMRFLFA